MGKDIVVLVHGVDSKGDWYCTAMGTLYPHFECKPIRYVQYEKWGKLKVVFWPRLFWLAWVFLLLALGALATRFGDCLFITCLILATVLLAAANILARVAAIRGAIGQFSDQLYGEVGHTRPHLIAHSFGTALSGLALDGVGWVRFGHVILAGAVLPRNFPWEKHYPHKFTGVWNDTGSLDLIGWLIFMFRFLTPHLGDSGRRGFELSQFVHTLANPWTECGICQKSLGFVHNITHGFFHSTALHPGHVEAFWLPILLGIPVQEYDDFLQWSTDLAEPDAETPGRGREFCERGWAWCKEEASSEPIVYYLRSLIEWRFRNTGPKSGRLVPRADILLNLAFVAINRMWALVADGRKAQADVSRVFKKRLAELKDQKVPDAIAGLMQATVIDSALADRARMIEPVYAANAAAKWAVGYHAGRSLPNGGKGGPRWKR